MSDDSILKICCGSVLLTFDEKDMIELNINFLFYVNHIFIKNKKNLDIRK